MPLSPLPIKLIRAWDGIDQNHPQLRELDEIVSLRKSVPFPCVGRTAWLPLEEPILVTTKNGETLTISALKIKGIGLYDQNGELHPPSNKHFHRPYRHHGIMKDGSFKIIFSASAPLGGITVGRALAEYDSSRVLVENNVSCQVPIRVYAYCDPELDFELNDGIKQSLGVVITGQLSRTYLRADIIERIDKTDEIRQTGLQVPPAMKDASSAELATRLLKDTYHQYGEILRAFSKSGLYRHNGHVVNLAVVPETVKIYLTDLDSSRFLEECSKIELPLQVLRDSASALYQLLFTVVEPRNQHLFPAELVLREKLIETYLQAYYHDVSSDRIAQVSAPLHDYFRHVYQTMNRDNPEENTEKSTKPAQIDYSNFIVDQWPTTATMPFEEAHAWLFAICRILHLESTINVQYPIPLSRAEFYKNLTDYAGAETTNRIQEAVAPLEA